MLKIISLTGSSTVLQSLIDPVDEDKFGGIESGDSETNLSNLFASKESTEASYLIFKGAKKGNGDIKIGVKAASGSDWLILEAKKTFNSLQHMFIQVPIFQHFDPE